MEYGKLFTPSNSPPPPGFGLMWDLGPSALDPFTLAEFRIKVPPPLSNFKIWSLLY